MSNFGLGWIAIAIVFGVVVIGIFNPMRSSNVIDFYDDDVHIAQRSGLNLIGGADISVTNVDDPGNRRVNITIGSNSESGIGSVATSTSSVVLAHSLGSVSNVQVTALDNVNTPYFVSSTSTENIVISVENTQTTTKRFYYRIYQ